MVNDNLKRRHEFSIATMFAAHLATTGISLSNLRNGNPREGEPDVVADGPAGSVGVEIADGWMSEDDARVTWTLARQEPDRRVVSSSGNEPYLSPLIAGPDKHLAAALQAQLDSHARRDYGIPTYLVLNGSHAPLTSAEDAPFVLACLRLPRDSRMTGVFLALTRNFSYVREFFEVTTKA